MPTEAVRLIHGDSRQVMADLPPGCINAVVTDPPYLMSGDEITYEHAGVADRTLPTTTVGMPWGYSLDWIDAAARLGARQWVVFAHFKMLGGLCAALEEHAEISAVFIWRKPNAPNMARPVPRMDCEFIVWARAKGEPCGRMREYRSLVIDEPSLAGGCMATERVLKPGSGQAFHPCQKPLAVVLPFVRRIAADRILDPFAGLATTGLACVAAGKQFIGIERDAGYVRVGRGRLDSALGVGGLFSPPAPVAADLFDRT